VTILSEKLTEHEELWLFVWIEVCKLQNKLETHQVGCNFFLVCFELPLISGHVAAGGIVRMHKKWLSLDVT